MYCSIQQLVYAKYAPLVHERHFALSGRLGRRLPLTALVLAHACLLGAGISRADAAAPAASSAGTSLFIREYVVRGNTVLQNAEIEDAVYPFVGPDRSADDIEKARQALEKLYQDKGFQTVQVVIPEPLKAGAVYLQVVEATVGRLRVVGSNYSSLREIKKEASSLQEGAVPNFNDVRKDLVTLNQIPHRVITPALKAGKDPGTVDVDLQVKDQLPITASLAVNNDHSVNTTPLRLNMAASYDNLWQQGHSIALSFQVAPGRPSDAELFNASYLAPFVGTPYSLQVTALKSDSNVSTDGAVTVLGKGVDIGLRGIMTLPGSERFAHSIQAGLDYKHFDENLNLGAASGAAIITPVTYFPFTVAYNAYLRERTATDNLSVSLNFASPRIGSNTSEFDAKRIYARGGAFYVRAEYDRTQDLPGKFQLFAKAQAEIADQPLIANDQFALGGTDSVRGYFVADYLADTGVSGTIEFRTPSLASLLFAPADKDAAEQSEIRFLAFLDGGTGETHQPLPGQLSGVSLLSAGLGATAKILGHVDGSIILAVPLISTGATRSSSRQILFNVGTEY
jgi:hemolysin activation/secretion protein